MLTVQLRKLPGNDDIPIPEKMSLGSSGYDLYAAVNDPCILHSGKVELIPTGIAVAMPRNLEAQVRSRSGLALKNGIFVLNSPGTIDSDYRGEICVILYNVTSEPFRIERKDRIAQLVFQEIPSIQLELKTTQLDETSRGSGGFGSTGR